MPGDPYSALDDQRLIAFVVKMQALPGAKLGWKSQNVYKEAEAQKICPGRTWQSMRERIMKCVPQPPAPHPPPEEMEAPHRRRAATQEASRSKAVHRKAERVARRGSERRGGREAGRGGAGRRGGYRERR
jgi:hypothetical protein